MATRYRDLKKNFQCFVTFGMNGGLIEKTEILNKYKSEI